MKLKIKPFSLAMAISITLPTLSSPAFAQKIDNYDEYNVATTNELEIGDFENYHPQKSVFVSQLIIFIYEYMPVVNRYLSNKLNKPIIPMSEKVKILQEYWDDFKEYFKKQTGKDADAEIDAVSYGF
ncbi:hypothetical protein [uncultured Anaerococcus sp.]|mgnify:CR=1 FL=1|uniref:hypothetical protein n=1 Tax=uncultured Anaerococcus sp. TaxID=293428 RepID=UPI00261C8EC2|nr:hypothetical protein [uncultured Anaerococcus sp.]